MGGNDIIDHINGNRTDDTKVNLRKTNHTGNAFNKKKGGNRKTSKPRQLAENGLPLRETIDPGISFHRLKSGVPAKHPWCAQWQEEGRSRILQYSVSKQSKNVKIISGKCMHYIMLLIYHIVMNKNAYFVFQTNMNV